MEQTASVDDFTSNDRFLELKLRWEGVMDLQVYSQVPSIDSKL